MAFDAFLKINGIDGESTDDKHKDWIEILSYSWGASQPASGSASSGGARSAERTNHQDFTVTHTMDKASPKLALHCSNGKHIPAVTLELCRATEDKQKYMEIKLSDVIVSSFSTSGSGSGASLDKETRASFIKLQPAAALPMEEFSFNYGKIEWVYTELDHKTGKAKGDVKAHWDLVANKGG